MGGRTGQLIAGVAAVLIALGVWSREWWAADGGVVKATVGLTQMRVCLGSQCESGPLDEGPRAFRTLAQLAFLTGLLAAGLLAVATLLAARAKSSILGRVASVVAVIFGVLALGAVLSFHGGQGLSMGWGFPVAAVGAVGGAVGGLVLGLDAGGVWEGRTYVPVKVGAGAPIPAPAPAPVPAAPKAVVVRRASSGPNTLAEAVKGRHRASQKISAVGPAAADSAAAAVRFFAESCVIEEAGLSVTYRGGVTLSLAWTEVASIAARQLPVDAPYEKALIVDLVPAAPSGARPVPVRLLASSRVSYAALPGGAAVSSIENLRKLAARVQEKNPAALLDPDSAPFFASRKPAPAFLSEAQLEEYDRRYAS